MTVGATLLLAIVDTPKCCARDLRAADVAAAQRSEGFHRLNYAASQRRGAIRN